MKNKIICLVLSVVLVAGLFGANGAYAWFVTSAGGGSASSGGYHWLSTGNVGYILTGSFTADYDSSAIVPEDELLSAFDEETNADDIAKISEYSNCKMFLESTSSVDSQLRIKIVYGYGNNAETVFDFSNKDVSPLTVEFTDASLWSSEGEYIYYGTYDAEHNASAVIPAYDATADGAVPVLIPLFDSIRYSGENTQSTMISGKTLNVKIIFEARQSEYVDWTQVGTYSSETV